MTDISTCEVLFPHAASRKDHETEVYSRASTHAIFIIANNTLLLHPNASQIRIAKERISSLRQEVAADIESWIFLYTRTTFHNRQNDQSSSYTAHSPELRFSNGILCCILPRVVDPLLTICCC